MRDSRYRPGLHRQAAPAETYVAIRPVAERIGVTRLADITGLDIVGIPVFQAIRPMARSLSVSQGKGGTRMAARVSALMEAVELHHAETVEGDSAGPPTPDDAAFCASFTPSPDRHRGWCAAVDLLTGRSLRLPHSLVSMDSTRPHDPDLTASTNGLASGNSLAEATVAALAEVIERDAHARWEALRPSGRRATSIAAASIDDRLGRLLLGRMAAAGLGVRLWDLGDWHDCPVILCAAFELSTPLAMTQAPAWGAGAHPSKCVALVRAVTEAAQSRATLVAGSRDDLTEADYQAPAAARTRLIVETALETSGLRDWRDLPDLPSIGSASDQAALLACCKAGGASVVARVDLTRTDIGVPVVKVVVPGFGDHGRASAFAAA